MRALTILLSTILLPTLFLIQSSFADIQGTPVVQKKLSKVEQMANFPKPFGIINFQSLAKKFDSTVFDFHQEGKYWPLIWIDQSGENFPETAFGIYTAVGDARQGPEVNDGTFHEAIGTMGAVLGASLVGIDKSTTPGLNYVGMLKNYFNKKTGWNIMQNNTSPKAGALGGGYGRDWWYDIFPNILFYAIYDLYPQEKDFDQIAKKIADQFYNANQVLDGNYNYSYFDYEKMIPVKNQICQQPDAAAGHAWVLYAAYKKFGESRYLAAAKSAMNALEMNKHNPSYEVLMPFGAYMAARLNAEEGSHYNVQKMLNWTFEGRSNCRRGWGVFAESWNGFDISGMVGNTKDHGGYGFLMNTYDLAWPLIALVRYDQSYARTVGKWMLNAANVAKLFYPAFMPPEHQSLPEQAQVTKGVIAYEGIVKHSSHLKDQNKAPPVAQGDGPNWVPNNPSVTQFSVYGSAHVGIFGSIIRPTNIPYILQLNLLATDFFRKEAFPTFLYYNPYKKNQKVRIDLDKKNKVDLYDSVSASFISRGVTSFADIEIPADGAAVISIIPANAKRTIKGNKLLLNNTVVDFHFQK